MFREVLILVSSAVAGYAWLCAIVSPVARSIHSLWSGVRNARVWRAFALAFTALAEDDPQTLARVEDLYRAHAVTPARRSRGVHRVAA
jgi:hypothetical protein